MQAVIVDKSLVEELMERRRTIGADRWDEVWNGVLHMNPSPSPEHQRIEKLLLRILLEVVEDTAMGTVFHQLNVADPEKGMQDYRIPDICVILPGSRAKIEETFIAGAPDFIIEIHSPDDETYEKLDWYAHQGVRELVIINCESKEVELYELCGGKLKLHSRSPQACECKLVPLVLKVRYEVGGNRLIIQHGDKQWVI
ncbi:MAG TPA: Uma2 family endonuclease [Armatimonadetes bacterium]|nr:Uma2 family endonuclease [Armatimonadota bacterium]